MKKFLDFYNEDAPAKVGFDPANFNTTPATVQVSLIPGRFSPFHRGHRSLAMIAKYPVIIGIIKGEKTSQDTDKNPFSLELQIEVIKAASVPRLKDIMVFKSANVPQMISDIRDKGYEVKEILVGSDRSFIYSEQLKKYGTALNSGAQVRVIQRNPYTDKIDGFTASKIRQALRTGNFRYAKNMLSNISPQLFDKLSKAVIPEF